ncbi:MAG: polysaccharide biosynthesis tyrosine autokinase [Chloroflexi bacterium]|nr:polysaccharide biosynthesis tyrosine autokinase [Chloroflexota bacterium]
MDNELEERSSLESILEYGQILLHWLWVLILAALLAGVAAYFITNRQPRVYESSTLMMVNGASGSQYDNSTSIYLGMQLASTYSRTMTTKPILDAVSGKLGYEVNSGSIKVQQIENTQLINITVTDTDPQRAADIANTLVSVFADQVMADQSSRYTDLRTNIETELANTDKQIGSINTRLAAIPTDTAGNAINPNDVANRAQLETSLSQYEQARSYLVSDYQQLKLSEVLSTSTVVQKDPAVANPSPIQPQPMRSALLAAVVGFMIAAGVVFLITFLEDTIRDPEEVTRKWGVPVLGVIARYESSPTTIITLTQPRAPVSESFRSLRTNLQFAGVATPLKTLVVTSPSPEDGKTSVVANLANVVSQNNRRVVVIDCDLRKPRLHKIFQLPNRVGLSDYFLHTQDHLTGAIKKTDVKGLSVISSGSLPPNPSELLGSDRMQEVIQMLGAHFNPIIIDTPPLLAVTDALVLASKVDGVILVFDPNKTKRAALQHSIEQLKHVNANLLGVVLNNVKVSRSHYYYNRDYYYGKPYGKAAEETSGQGTFEASEEAEVKGSSTKD